MLGVGICFLKFIKNKMKLKIMVGTIDFIKGGIESSPNFSLEAEVKFTSPKKSY